MTFFLQVSTSNLKYVRYNARMAKRYDQYCPVAPRARPGRRAVGAARRPRAAARAEALHRPVDGLPGIGTNVLAARLRELEAGGVVQKRKLPPPAASTVYELTDVRPASSRSRSTRSPAGAPARSPPPAANEDFYPDWGLNAFAALLDPRGGARVAETYVVRVADDVYTVRLEDSKVHVEAGAADEADLDFATDRETFFAMASGELDPRSVSARPRDDRGREAGGARRASSRSSTSTHRAQVAV